ncbi:unnamed protein product [Brassica oleracea var. botrytis]
METYMFFFFGFWMFLYIRNSVMQTFVPFPPDTIDSCGSLMLSVDSSQECEPTDLTPAKRRGTVIDNLDETFDQNSVSRTLCSTRIKKEKTDKSG